MKLINNMKKIGTCILNLILILLAAYIVLMQVCPDKIKNFIGYQPFVILTDSMEPLIPTGSAVLVKNFKEDEEPEEDTIISFNVDRLGTPTVFTHYFREKQIDKDGRVLYRTQGLSAERYDDYKTYREDLIGTYVGHIPYVGKYILFLQSPFALIELGIILLLIVIHRILWEKFDREEQMALEAAECEAGTVDFIETTFEEEPVEEEENIVEREAKYQEISEEISEEECEQAETRVEIPKEECEEISPEISEEECTETSVEITEEKCETTCAENTGETSDEIKNKKVKSKKAGKKRSKDKKKGKKKDKKHK